MDRSRWTSNAKCFPSPPNSNPFVSPHSLKVELLLLLSIVFRFGLFFFVRCALYGYMLLLEGH